MLKKVTIKDVAKEAGVSVALVSFVMNNRVEENGRPKYRVSESTRQHVLEVARRMGYGPAGRIFRQERRKLVAGVILPNPSHPYYSSFAAQLERLALPQGCTLLYGYSQDNPSRFERLAELFLDQKPDGLVVIPADGTDVVLEAIRSTGIPCVVPEVAGEPLSSATECARHLFRLIEEKENQKTTAISL